MLARLAGALLVLLALTLPAQAQRMCGDWSFRSLVGPDVPIAMVTGKPGTRIYLCGYVVSGSAQTLVFALVSGIGPNCTGETALTPAIKVPEGGFLVNRTPYPVEFTEVGHTLCLHVTAEPGQQGQLSITIYWLQL